MKTYSETECQILLENLEDWNFKENALERNFQFKNFSQSLAFIVQVGLLAEKANHHPEILNVYNKVRLRLTTHDANGVTEKDFDLARKISLQFTDDSFQSQ
jgi:4a-hydroxytetrahydrobiopterin dehydratase